MEPAYVNTSLTSVVGDAQALGERVSQTEPVKLNALLPNASSTDSTDKVVPERAVNAYYNEWPQVQQDFNQPRFYQGLGQSECWQYPYGMPPMYMENCCDPWGGAALVEGSPPPPQGPSMIYCAENGHFSATPPQLSATLLGSQQLQPLNVVPGLLDPTAARCPTLAAHASSASSFPASSGCSPEEMRANCPPISKDNHEGLPYLAAPLCRAKTCPAAPVTPQSPTIRRTTCKKSGVSLVRWTVDSRKLKVKDRVAVSPSFELGDNIRGNFRMMLYPTAVSDRKGGASFKKAKGKGSIHIKSESSFSEVHDGLLSMTLLVRGKQDNSDSEVDDFLEDVVALRDGEAPRGPILHNFQDNGICSLPKENEEWDFGKAADEESQHFVVLLRVDALDAKSS
eukprot:TRINITY_DN1887_c0_g1_i4.p1 TRINITY_DN1887_c0_g1~~TRINITY_DN1887_c0_g1_i4.p1  ORF type:complete len:397 (-),score=63.61 TRINITY_DN1887_c0_g1_i4:158-1348(-)